MSSVLVGMFDTRAAAEEARTKLMAAGLTPGQVTWNAEGGSSTGTTGTSGIAGTTGMGSTATSSTAPEKEGMFTHFFRSIFGSDDDTTSDTTGTYREAFNRGGFGLTVNASSDADIQRATDILDDCGAFDVDERSQQWKNEGWAGSAATASTGRAAMGEATMGEGMAAGTTNKLNIVEESLAVGKRTVGRGGVRVFSRVVEVPVQETVHLREEHADIQRKVVDRPATEADFAAFKEGSIEVRSSAEEAVVGKSARVVGEVEVGTKVTERDEVVRDTVRKTEVDVEQIPAGGMSDTTSDTSRGTTTGLSSGSSMAGSLDSGSTLGRSGSTLTGGSPNLDPITGEPGAHPVGTGVGAVAGGVATGAAVGTVAGPIGTAIGAAAGAVVGGLAGKGVAEKIDPTTGKKYS